ncbi:YadA-like family protein [Dyella silvae]|uniref:YadA-like family protein n=1 Tax=Dyella silvae TaxID=2994424 RepID=UPI0022647B0C|nr:YadA-like family protein [Dyella silvae]
MLWDTAAGAYSATHGSTTNNKIVNVADGTNANDAVNFSQLDAINTKGAKYFHANSTKADATPTGTDSIAIGPAANASATESMAQGLNAKATANQAVALGSGASATTALSVAIGANAVASATTLGTAGYNPGKGTLAAPTAYGELSVGDTGKERRITNVAAGLNNTDAVNVSQLKSAVAAGTPDALLWDTAAGAYSATHGSTTNNKIVNVANGTNANDAVNFSQLSETNTNVTNLDNRVTTVEDNVTNLQDDVTNLYNKGAKYFHANSTGADSKAQGTDAVAIGTNAVATNANDVALGADSVTSATTAVSGVTLGGSSYTFAGATPSAALSVGGRQIQNVAAGQLSATSTDAVNGSQLYATNQAINSIVSGGTSTKYFHANSTGTDSKANGQDAVAVGVNAVAADANGIAIGNGATTVQAEWGLIGNIAMGAGAYNHGNNAVVIGNKASSGDETTWNEWGGSVTIGNGAVTKKGGQLALGGASAATAAGAIALGLNAVGSGWFSTAIQTAAVASGANAVAIGTGANAEGSDAIAIGGNGSESDPSLTGANAQGARAVALGSLAKASADDAVALGSNSVASRTGMNGAAELFSGTTVASTMGAISVGDAGKERQITNVAGGTQDTDAVNVRQLNAVAQSSSDLSDRAVKYDLNADGTPTSATTAVSSATVGDITYGGFAGSNPNGAVSVGSAGNERQIQNVAAGQISANSTDAVNGSQLYSVATEVSSISSAVNNISGGISNVTNQVNQNTADVTNIKNGSDGMFQVSKDANTSKPVSSGKKSTAGGNGAVASADSSTAIGNSAQATASNSVAIGAGSVADRANSVSMGTAGGERQITNVAAGTQATDAVNVSQLQASQAGTVRYDTNADGSVNSSSLTMNQGGPATTIHNVAPGTAATDAVNVSQLQQSQNWAKNYTDDQVNKMGKKAYSGSAAAIATANLPQAYQPNQSSAGVAIGNYHGQNAIAVGVSTITESGRYIFKASATGSQQGGVGVGVGAGMVW